MIGKVNFLITRSSHGYMHMRIQLTPSGHYILGYHPDYQLNQNYIGINNLSIYRTVQSTLCLNRWYGLYHFICSSILSMEWTYSELALFQVNYYTVNRLPIKGAEHVSLKAPLCEQLLWPVTMPSKLINQQLADEQSVSQLIILSVSCFERHQSCHWCSAVAATQS